MLGKLGHISLVIESQKVLTTACNLVDICNARLECSILDIVIRYQWNNSVWKEKRVNIMCRWDSEGH